MHVLLSQHSEFLIFAPSIAAAFGIHAFSLRKTKRAQLPWLIWMLAATLLLTTWHLTEQAGTREQKRIEEMTGDFARLYGDEIQKRGHSRLGSDTATDDPLYLDLIETEKRWLALNPSVNDIYTLRKRADGRIVLIVDSETDYNNDGKYEGEREQRTPIGEVYEGALLPSVETALAGEPAFMSTPYTDRWGTWVSACVPLRAPDGRIEGVLGVDFDAGNFMQTVAAAKWRVIGLMGLVQLVLLGSSTATSLLRAEVVERKRAHAVLRESEERFRGTFEQAAVGIAHVSTEGRFLRVNDKLCGITGHARKELLGMAMADLTMPEDVADCIEARRAMLAGEQSSYTAEKRFLRRDGVGIWVNLVSTLEHTATGEPKYFTSVFEDITGRKLAEDELRWKTAFLEAQVNSSPDGILVVDEQGHKILQNQRTADLFKIPREIADDQDDKHQIRWVTDMAKNPDAFSKRVAQLYAHPHEIGRDEIDLKDGTVLDRYSFPVVGNDGKYYGRTWMFRDITEHKKAAQELEQLNRQLQDISRHAGMAEVATGVLHNVGNVLNSVNVAATCVADGVRRSKLKSLTRTVAMLREHEQDLPDFFSHDPRGAQLPGFLEQLAGRLADEQSATLTELANLQKNIEHIKDIVAMQQSYGKISGVLEKLDLAELVEDTLRMSTETLARHRVQVVREFAEVPPVTVDKHKVLQILVNLVGNAKHACEAADRPDRTLTVRVFNGDGAVKVAISDNGIGIPSANLHRIFNHGFTTKRKGHGFGLHTGALAAAEMGGSLKVHSDGPGHGATFTLVLPLNPS